MGEFAVTEHSPLPMPWRSTDVSVVRFGSWLEHSCPECEDGEMTFDDYLDHCAGLTEEGRL